jgi:carnosine N-methyltransferase
MSEDIEEYRALTSTLLAFYHYHQWEYDQLIVPRTNKYNLLPVASQELLPWFPKYIEDLKACITMNQEFTQALALIISQDWGVTSNVHEWLPAGDGEYEKVSSTLLQLAREWSSEGEEERRISYQKIVDELITLYPDELSRQKIKVLVPGCGLGRLVLDLVKSGFWCQGNEFSYHMLLASNFVLNHCKYAHNYSIFPYLHKASHLVKRLNQLRPVTIPDVSPTEIHDLMMAKPSIPYDDLMSMTAGSFIDLYGPPGLEVSPVYSDDQAANDFRTSNFANYDVVVTSFFLDTASNVIEYLKAIKYCLKDDGKWINFGPLLWHFQETSEDRMKGLELSRDDLIELAKTMGFVFKKREEGVESTYSGDRKAMGAYVFKCEYWVVRLDAKRD